MQSRIHNYPFDVNFNFGVENLLVASSSPMGTPFPPVAGNFELLNGTDFLLLDGTNFLLL